MPSPSQPTSPSVDGETRKALEFYRDEVAALARYMTEGKENKSDEILASVTVLSLDGGRRANAALSTLPQSGAETIIPVLVPDANSASGQRVKWQASPSPALDPATVEALPDDIRAQGWMVAVHITITRLNGLTHTFWLFVKDGCAIKGEGITDSQALNAVRRALTGKDKT